MMGMLNGGNLVNVCDRILVAKVNWGTIVTVYAPINGDDGPNEEKEKFDVQLRSTLQRYGACHCVDVGAKVVQHLDALHVAVLRRYNGGCRSILIIWRVRALRSFRLGN